MAARFSKNLVGHGHEPGWRIRLPSHPIALATLCFLFAGPANVPPRPPPAPSLAGTLTVADRLYRSGDHAGAAAAYLAVATGPGDAEAMRGELGLVKSLQRLGLPSAAKTWALRIADETRNHPQRRAALPWLVALARDLDPDPQLLAALATYDETALADEQFDEIRADLGYMVGRARYEAGDLERAVVALAEVTPEAEDYVPAQYLAGVAHTRLADGQAAMVAFKNVLRTNAKDREARDARTEARIDRWSDRRIRLRSRGRNTKALQRRMARRGWSMADLDRYEEHRRIDEMTSLSMGYVFYQAGQLELASKYFLRLPQSSPYWLEAIFADAWAEFLAAYSDGDNANAHYQRVLGHVHTLRAPFFPYRLFPEEPLLAAVTYYYNCRYGSAERALDDFDARYGATRKLLDQFLEEGRTPLKLAELYATIEAGEDTGLPEATHHVVEGLVDDRDLERRWERAQAIDAETKRLGDLSSELRDHVHERIDAETERARRELGQAIVARLEGAVQEIRRFERQAIGIRYELAPKLAEHPGTPSSATRPRPDVTHDLYEYNGEYWQDELGHYRVEITSLCKE